MFRPLGSSWLCRRVQKCPCIPQKCAKFIFKGCRQAVRARGVCRKRLVIQRCQVKGWARKNGLTRSLSAQVKMVGWQLVRLSPAWPLARGISGSFQAVLLWDQLEPDAFRTSPQICKSDGLSVWQVSAGPREMKLESPERMNLSLCSCRKTLRDSPQAGRPPAAALCPGGGGGGLIAAQILP